MSYDITQHLSYNVPSSSSSVASAAILESVTLRPLSADAARANVQNLQDSVRSRAGRVQPGQLFLFASGEGSDALSLDFVIVECLPSRAKGEPPGAVDKATEVRLDTRPLPALAKCHVLPYEDAKPPNPNLVYDVYLKPYLFERCGPIHDGFEFAYKDCRFRVVGTQPPSREGDALYVSRETEMFWKGPPLQRSILRSAQALPYFQTLPQGGMDEAARVSSVRSLFEQRSAPVKATEEFTTECGVRFRVVKCEPSCGAIAASTRLSCDGPPLMACGVCGSLAVRRCEAPGCGKLICTPHTKHVTQDGSNRTFCPEHAGNNGCVLQ